ncbi:MAG: response regulator, partial [Nitrospirales bacterium]
MPTVQSAPGAPPRARILLAEDNTVNQKLVVRLLERSGYCVDVANNGREALDAFNQRPYDIILMDCQMPQMDGLTAAAEIRRREGILTHTPIIALTANSQQQDRQLCRDVGMDDYLSKPFHWDALFDVVERWLPKRVRRPLDTPPVQGASTGVGATCSLPHLDHEVLAELQELNGDDDPAFFQTLIMNFLSDTAQHVTDMLRAFTTRDVGELKRKAHYLKGTCGNLGAKRLGTFSKELQTAAEAGDLGLAGALLTQIEADVPILKQALMAELNRKEREDAQSAPMRPWPQSILIVEDERNMRMIIKRIVMRLGCKRVQDAFDGTRALALLKQGPVELVITDWEYAVDGWPTTSTLHAAGQPSQADPRAVLKWRCRGSSRARSHQCGARAQLEHG